MDINAVALDKITRSRVKIRLRNSIKLAVALLLALAAIGLLGLLISAAYRISWLGFSERPAPPEGLEPAKTLWDWMELCIAPLFLAIIASFIALWFSRQQRIAAKRSELHQAYKVVLESFLDRMTQFLVEHSLRESPEESVVRDITRAWTLSSLRRLDGKHRSVILQFLNESGLITKGEEILSLEGADLQNLWLTGFDLRNANLNGADMTGASVDIEHDTEHVSYLAKPPLRVGNIHYMANLAESTLAGTRFYQARMGFTYLRDIRAPRADFRGADLNRSILAGADFNGAWFEGSNLQVANLAGADLRNAIFHGPTGCFHTPFLFIARIFWWIAGLDNVGGTAMLHGADLSGADLRGATISEKQLASVRSLEGAILHDEPVGN